MASHVVVIDPTARRTTVKTTPGSYLTDVRNEACQKLGVKPDDYTLKYNQKPVDLSRTIRLSGLPQGAKLDLVQQSRSPSVVSVALQLPASDNNVRLTKKFPSNTSLWQVLRVLESAPPPGSGTNNINLTQRAVAEMEGIPGSGSGRLNYEMPVLSIMGRDRSSFVELQQTLGQLGLTGSALLRLSYKNSGKPLEDAMAEISQYFKSTEESPALETNAPGARPGGSDKVQTVPVFAKVETTPDPTPRSLPEPMEDVIPSPAPQEVEQQPQGTPSEPPKSSSGPDERPVVIFSAPSTSTPQAASQPYNANDYNLSVDQARRYQNQLQQLTRNKRLPSDKEIAEVEKAKTEKLAAIQEVKIRIRMPDQTMIEVTFNRDETSRDVCAMVRKMLAHGDQPFLLRYTSSKGALVPMKDEQQKLVADLGFQGRVLVTCTWDDAVPMSARQPPSLKEEYRKQAQALKVDVIASSAPERPQPAGAAGVSKGKGRADDGDKESKLKNLLNKGLFKKR